MAPDPLPAEPSTEPGRPETSRAPVAILSTAIFCGAAQLEPFLVSVRDAVPNATVFLIVHSDAPKDVVRIPDRFGFVVLVREPRRRLRKHLYQPGLVRRLNQVPWGRASGLRRLGVLYGLHVCLWRFFAARNILTRHAGEFVQAMFCDSRDVVIQSDPFPFATDRLLTGEEARRLGEDPANLAWIRRAYSGPECQALAGRPILCAGVTLGPTSAMLDYLGRMCAELWGRAHRAGAGPGLDQAVHNGLAYLDGLAIHPTPSQEGIIATLHFEQPSDLSLDRAGDRILVRGRPPAIVHQYDRHPALYEWVGTRASRGEGRSPRDGAGLD